tara:strand:+ start:1845 stop:2963 length:1119 start_codon:yes stop_codon:yes gene_type:complete
MTVSTTTNRTELVGNGTVGPYTLTFPILNNGDLKVYVGGTLKTLTTHYTVANAGSGLNATVTFTSSEYPSPGTSLSSSISLVFVRNVSNTQPSNYQNNDIFDAETLEQSLDRATMQIQQSGENSDRSIRFGDTATGIDTSVTEITAAATTRANKLISFDAQGNVQVTQEIGTFKGNWAASTVYVARDLVKQDSDTSSSTKDNIYICIAEHTSSGANLLANDSAKWTLVLDVASASGGLTEAIEWSTKTNGQVVGSTTTDYSAKAYALGGTGLDSAAGSAKDWATKTGATVGNTSEYSAKHYATTGNVATVASNIANVNTVATDINNVVAKVSKSGDTMTGALTLSGAPTADNHASTKSYTDSQATALALALG